jgi:hypothetical protein
MPTSPSMSKQMGDDRGDLYMQTNEVDGKFTARMERLPYRQELDTGR